MAEAGKPVKVTVPDLEVDPKTTPVAKATSTETAPVAKNKAPEPPPPESSGLGGQRIAALVVGGVGVVSTAVGGYFALRARAANDRAQL